LPVRPETEGGLESAVRLGAILLSVLSTACTARPVSQASRAIEPHWSYEVVASRAAQELSISVQFEGETDSELTVGAGAEPYVYGVEVLEPRGWRGLESRKGSWFLANPCHARCTVRYGVRLGDEARAETDSEVARAYDGGRRGTWCR